MNINKPMNIKSLPSLKTAKTSLLMRAVFSLLLFAACYLFLYLKIPQYLLYQEQYQLFLFTGDYFLERISVPGGFADWISEFVVQFYYMPICGAALAALLLTMSQVFLGLACRRCSLADAVYALSALPSVMLIGAMGDENVLLSATVALMLATLFLMLDSFRRPASVVADTLMMIAGFAILYWLAGGVAFVFVVAVGILRRRFWVIPAVVAIGCAGVWISRMLWFDQYPLIRLLHGLNYYRVPEMFPPLLYAVAAVVALLPALTCLNVKKSKAYFYIAAGLVALFAVVWIPGRFDDDKSRVFAYDSLVRQGRWNDIIERGKKERPTDDFSLQAINLALGMTGTLGESMFQYPQTGQEGLIGGMSRLDNTSQLVTAEALYRIGLTNIAFSTTFDLQESIMNDRKSGRLMKRLAECMIIKGEYNVAAKYIAMLRKSLFYSDWARNAEKLLGDDRAVEAHPVYGPMRRNSFSKVGFYDTSQLEKIFAMLAFDSEGSNMLAMQYFAAAAMLKGDLPTLAGVYNSMDGMFGEARLPRHVQEALAMYWTFGHDSFDGIPFPLGAEVKQQTAALASAAMQSPDNQSAWEAAAPGSFGIYFLNLQRNSVKKAPSAQAYQQTHE